MNLNLDKLEKLTRQSNGGFIARCPACALNGEDKTGNHLSILPDGRFNCVKYSKDKGHNTLIFRVLKGEDTSGIEYSEEHTHSEQPSIKSYKTWPLSILDGLVKNYEYWNDRGISSDTCAYFNIGVATRGQLKNRTVIPIFSKENKNLIIGFTGRTLKKDVKPKWKHISDLKQKWLIPALDEEIKTRKSVILVESPGCFLSLFEHGVKNTLCLFGLKAHDGVISYLIKKNPKRILIATNNEPGNNNIGNEAALKIKEQLKSFFAEERLIIALPSKKDFNEMSREEILQYEKDYLSE
jgi:hypothetical protein